MNKGAINSNVPIYESLERVWDSGEAVKRVKAWATKDGQLDIEQYSKAFFWAEGGDNPEDFKLPFADVEDGELKAVWNGVSAAMTAVIGKRSGVELSDDDSKSVYDAISKYYESFQKDLPDLATKAVDAPAEEPDDEEDEPVDKMAGALYVWKSGEGIEEPVYGLKAFYNAEEKIAVASTDVQDRQGERIDQNGWDLKNFKGNNVMLWAHDHTKISVGNARNIHIERKSGKPQLVFTPDFHEATPEAKALKVLYDEGRMNSFSVGFIPKDFDAGTSTYLKQELLEISAVNVPANPEATMSARKSLITAGIEKSVVDKMAPVEEDKKDKGAVADEISREDTFDQKRLKMNGVWKVMYAFCDVFFDEETELDSFSDLLKETIGILGKVGDGETLDEGTPIADMLILGVDESKITQLSEVLEKAYIVDKLEDTPESNHNDTPDLVKVQDTPSTAPSTVARAEQSLVKVIARASDHLLQGEKHGQSQEERVKMQKVIKRAAEILSKSQRSKLDGKTS